MDVLDAGYEIFADDQAAPKCSITMDATNRRDVDFTGRMPEPRRGSDEIKALLVNGLAYRGRKRKCKTAGELKAALQDIQFHHMKEAYNSNDEAKYEAYRHDLEEEKFSNIK